MNKIIARALSRTRRHAPTHAQVCTHIRALAHANTRLYTHAHTHVYACLHTHTHSRMHTPAHANARLHILTHTLAYA